MVLLFKKNKFQGKFVNVEHHISHIASSYLVSGYDEAIGLSIDGFEILQVQQVISAREMRLKILKE